MFMSCFMVINGSCSTNMYARQLSFNFSSMVWGHGPVPPPLDPPLNLGQAHVLGDGPISPAETPLEAIWGEAPSSCTAFFL